MSETKIDLYQIFHPFITISELRPDDVASESNCFSLRM